MKKSALPLALLLLGLTLSGCPVYDSADYGCYSDFDCPSGYVCDGNSLACVAVGPPVCSKPSDCDTNETCSRSGTCEHVSCHFASVGCVRGYECSIDTDTSTWKCIRPATGAGGADSGGGGEANAGASPVSAGAPAMSNGGAPEPASSAGAGG
ncbi:MAG TPA: hypothetical protein VNG33_11535 [Polyangiaceae bacterium]|nr:hypothetical protein [Polyangiaceae bacterium]